MENSIVFFAAVLIISSYYFVNLGYKRSLDQLVVLIYAIDGYKGELYKTWSKLRTAENRLELATKLNRKKFSEFFPSVGVDFAKAYKRVGLSLFIISSLVLIFFQSAWWAIGGPILLLLMVSLISEVNERRLARALPVLRASDKDTKKALVDVSLHRLSISNEEFDGFDARFEED